MNIMDNLVFGIPKRQKTVNNWNFNPETASIKIEKDRGSKQSKRIFFNKKAYDILSKDESFRKLGISFDLDNKEVRFANVETLEVEHVMVTKNPPYSISNSKIHQYVSSLLELDISIDNVFEVVKEESSLPLFKMITEKTEEPSNEVEISNDTEVIDNTINIEETPVEEEIVEVVEPINNYPTEPVDIIDSIDSIDSDTW